MTNLNTLIEESDLYKFAKEAHEARFPAFAWKAVACDMMGLPVGCRPSPAQMLGQRNSWASLWLELTIRFDQLSTVRWAEHLECEEERIHNTLRYLGSTPDKVAQNLSAMGIMGTTMEACDCPLHHFFTGVYGAWFTKAFRGDIYVDFARCANPVAIEHMITAFDNGHLPKLDPFADTTAVL